MLETVGLYKLQLDARVCHLLVVSILALLISEVCISGYLNEKEFESGPAKDILKVPIGSPAKHSLHIE